MSHWDHPTLQRPMGFGTYCTYCYGRPVSSNGRRCGRSTSKGRGQIHLRPVDRVYEDSPRCGLHSVTLRSPHQVLRPSWACDSRESAPVVSTSTAAEHDRCLCRISPCHVLANLPTAPRTGMLCNISTKPDILGTRLLMLLAANTEHLRPWWFTESSGENHRSRTLWD